MEQVWDVVVVGAGIIGLSVGYELARLGMRTAIIEERTPASGATQASAGVLAPYIEAPGEGALHELTIRSLSLYDAFVAAVEHDSGVQIEYGRGGTLEIATSTLSSDRLRSLGRSLSSAGLYVEWLDGTEAVRREPALATPEGALFVATHGYVRVAQLTAALHAAATARGASVLERAKVEQVVAGADGVVTSTAGGDSHRSGLAVIAAGSWSGLLVPGAPKVTPIRGQLLQLQWKGPPITRVLWSEFCYIVPWTDGTVLVGATVEDVGYDQRTTVDGVRSLMEAACRLLPSAGEATFVAARAGLRPSTADGVPLIGRSATHSRLLYATGHFRNGVLLAPLTARLIAGLATDDCSDPALALTAPER
jgi:glycine oxidase